MFDDNVLISEEVKDEIDLDSMVDSDEENTKQYNLLGDLNATPIKIIVGSQSNLIKYKEIKNGDLTSLEKYSVLENCYLKSISNKRLKKSSPKVFIIKFYVTYMDFLTLKDRIYDLTDNIVFAINHKLCLDSEKSWTFLRKPNTELDYSFSDFKDGLVKVKFVI